MPVEFGEVLDSVAPCGDGWSATVPDDWTQGRTAYGGLQGALLARAMRQVVRGAAELPLRSLQVTFVGPVRPGPVELRPAVLRRGRTAWQARCDLLQDGSPACTAVGIFGAPRSSRIAIEIARPQAPAAPEDLRDLPFVPGVTPPFVQHVQLRWALGRRSSPGGASEPHSMVYARLRDRRCTPEEALVALADSIPTPALVLLEKPLPVSSLNWMLELIGDPAALDLADWSLLDTRVRAGADGYLSQTSVLFGPSGHAFAVSHQTVAIFG